MKVMTQPASLKQLKAEIETLLGCAAGVELLRKYLTTEFCVENLDFMLHVRALNPALCQGNLFNTVRLDRDRTPFQNAVVIYQRFIGEDAEQQVNLAHENTRQLVADEENGTLDETSFDRAYQEVLALVASDNYRRMRIDKHYTKPLKSLLDPRRGFARIFG
jgi:hypothetical protein